MNLPEKIISLVKTLVPEAIKNFMLNSAEHEFLNAHRYKNIKKFSISQAQISLECYFSCSKMLKCQQFLAF